MGDRLFARLLASLIGGVTGMVLVISISGFLSSLSPQELWSERSASFFSNASLQYVYGMILLIVVNVMDTDSRKPRNYWCFGIGTDLSLPAPVCFVYGLFAPFYLSVTLINYLIAVHDRSTYI